ncbi:MAG: small multi-drug export protein [Methanobacterium sp. BRmetb2]|nr:MAG: small multi-drug export protein [Methanobacterium sp. BRmetb2]
MEVISLVTIFGLAILELWVAIPAGFAFELNPILIIILSTSGNIAGALIILVIGENIRDRILKWRLGDDKKNSRLYHIWNKYGLIGLGLSSPLLFGAWLGTALGVALDAPNGRLMPWMSVGIILWSIGLTTAIYYGISFLNI